MLEQQKRLSDIQLQVATEKRILRPSDDPTGASQILRLDQAIASTQQFQRNADAALNRLTLEETSLSGVEGSLQRIREIAVQASNSTLSTSDRSALAQEVRERLNELVSFGNTRDANQEYLFSGNMVTTKPFAQSADGSFVYSGDQGQRALQISTGRQIADSDSGNNVFVNIKNGNGSFQINETASNMVVPGFFTTAASDGAAAVQNDTIASGAHTTTTGTAGTGGTYAITVDGVIAASITKAANTPATTVAAGVFTNSVQGVGQTYSLDVDGINVISSTNVTVTAADIDTALAGAAGTALNTAGVTFTGTAAGNDLVFSRADGVAFNVDVTNDATSGGFAGADFATGTNANTNAGTAIASVTAAEIDAQLAANTVALNTAGVTFTGSATTGDLVFSRADGVAFNTLVTNNFLGMPGGFTTTTDFSVGTHPINNGSAAVPVADTAFTMSIDGTQFFTKAAGVGVTVTAAELDTALNTFVAANSATYKIESGSIATGNLILSKADKTSVTLSIDSNFSNTAGSFSGKLQSSKNTGTGVYQIGNVVDPSAYVVETYTINFVTNSNNNLAYNVVGSVSGQIVPVPPQDAVLDAPDYSDGGTMEFNGIQTGISGTPDVGDSFTISPSETQDMFTTVHNLITAMETEAITPSDQSDIFNGINTALSEIDLAFDNVIRVRTNVGARLRTIEDQSIVNDSFRIEMTATLSEVRDLDITEAAVELKSRLISLEAAQSTYTRIQGLSLFQFIS